MIININNVDLSVERIPNIDIFSFDLSDVLPEPQVPEFYIEEQDRWEKNYQHPTYHAAMSIYYTARSIALFDKVIKEYIQVVNPQQIVIPKQIRRIYPDEDDKYIFLKYILFDDDEDVGKIVNSVTLTETRVYSIFNSLTILREGMNIHEHDVKHTVNTNIEYEPLILGGYQLVHPIDEYNGCITSNISYVEWMANQYSLDSMAKSIALYRLNKIIEIHSGDAAQIESDKKSKKH